MNLFTVGCLALLAAGCTRSADDDVHERAMKSARDKVDEVTNAIGRDYVWRADDLVHSAGQVKGVEVMGVDGASKNSGNGVALIIRVHGVATRFDARGQPSGELDLPVCFQLTYGHDDRVDEVKCPTTAPIGIPKDPQLPGDIDATLRQVLASGAAATEDAIRASVDGLALDPGVGREVVSRDGAIGMALRAGRYDCVMGRVTPTAVEVWRPSRIQLAPGEGSCTADAAARGYGQKPPH